jgi:hypothetical protein
MGTTNDILGQMGPATAGVDPTHVAGNRLEYADQEKNMKTLTLETTAPFQGLAELVAYDEGLFEKEGLAIKWADREKGVDKRPQLDITDVTGKGVNRYASHGRLLEEGKADLYNACEWGNYSRVETTQVGSRQIGRRSIVTFAALVVRGDSPVQTPQQFANRQIGGSIYLTDRP